MLKSVICLICAISFHQTLIAQTPKTYNIKPGEEISDVLKNEDIYRYKDFTAGTVYFKNGSSGSALLNYNFLEGEMNFVDAKGDTMALDNVEEVKHIVISKDTFYYQKGFLASIYSSKNITLAKLEVIRMGRIDRAGAFDNKMPSGSQSYSNIQRDIRMRTGRAREYMTLTVVTDYYIGDKYDKFTLLNKKSLLRYTENEKAVSEFLNKNDINFSKEEDLKKVIEFLQTL
jgi:hypothetical protein